MIDDEYRKNAEFNAYSVRQLIAQRSRLFAIIDIVAGALKGANLTSDVLASVGQTQSQFYQDIFCLLANGGKRNGFFVEFGAADGVMISNTHLLETKFGWSGILAEPGHGWLDELRQNRNCIIDTRCVTARTGDRIKFSEGVDKVDALESTAMSDRGTGITYEVETVSIGDLLKEHAAPSHIDFLSIDVEGGELDVLSAFPFDLHTIGFLCVEHHTEKEEASIRELLARQGYRQILREVSGHDGFYVPSV